MKLNPNWKLLVFIPIIYAFVWTSKAEGVRMEQKCQLISQGKLVNKHIEAQCAQRAINKLKFKK